MVFLFPPMFSKLLVEEEGDVVGEEGGEMVSLVLSFVVRLRRSGILFSCTLDVMWYGWLWVVAMS